MSEPLTTHIQTVLAGLRAAALDRSPYDPSRLDRRDPELIDAVLPLFEALNRGYLKLRVQGIENVSGEPALFVGNHSGGIMGPDLSCTMATLWRTLGTHAPLYAMAHDLAMRHIPPLGRVLQRAGCMRADPANAHAVLSSGGYVLVYPGGELDAFRTFRERNRVVFGPRKGFVRVAARAKVPIVPIVAHGAHSSGVILHDGAWVAALFKLRERHRVERIPIALALPWGVGVGPLPYLPLPFPITLRILPPIEVTEGDDEATVRDHVVACMQSALDEMAHMVR